MSERNHALVLTFALLAAVPAASVQGADDPVIEQVKQVQKDWETIKFTVPEGDRQTRLMETLGARADALAASNPDRVEALIWDGIVTSERASMVGSFSALPLANRARDILEKAYGMNPTALDAGAPTSLGVLYYRVPGFPIAFGDKTRARKLLEQAVTTAPKGLDAWYFYGDFLMAQGEYARAREAFAHALSLPANAERQLWDKNRRLVIQEKLDDIKDKR